MRRLFIHSKLLILFFCTAFLSLCTTISSTAKAQKLYNPIPLTLGSEISDILSEKDIPTGQGGFARDYIITLTAGDQVAIDLTSTSFDAIVSLISEDGSTVAENDDGPDGNTNSLLFSRVTKTGNYIVRVRAFGETGVGPFTLKVTRLRPVP
ncbi:MAG: PPC domain-containing protein [Oscillatoriaceae bacterium SKW80]|nr:PPC domain-containing protein [Oscillatoriaceae bacterium SKYG93]MCX8119682.1 PPC domain-containing protein [Oscillatoriaceae bacterium SKW80]MDW8452441.1 PPC domain-containing protein [Oscillatoriaceae cyanobacterium SKYGB_i_bin93]HIK27585.1 PPC domain-containing protein [Oscillatoriaceae cyanobacterium M7585_C2015_266]